MDEEKRRFIKRRIKRRREHNLPTIITRADVGRGCSCGDCGAGAHIGSVECAVIITIVALMILAVCIGNRPSRMSRLQVLQNGHILKSARHLKHSMQNGGGGFYEGG